MIQDKRIAAFAGIIIAAGFAAGCSSSSSSVPAQPKTGTETLSATDTGAAAADNLNSNSNAPLSFPEGTWSGLVSVTLKPFSLPNTPGNANQGDAAWTTAQGRATVFHKNAPGFSNNSSTPPPATWTKSGSQCYFVATFSKGAFQFLPAQSTGEFARLSGTGTYVVTAKGNSPLKSGQSKCGFTTTGTVEKDGASITFTATAPAILHPAPTASPTS